MVSENADSSGLVDAFTQGGDDFLDAPGGGFEPAHSGIMTLAKAFAASLTAEPLNGFCHPFDAITDQGVNGLIGDAIINAVMVRA